MTFTEYMSMCRYLIHSDRFDKLKDLTQSYREKKNDLSIEEVEKVFAENP